MSKPKEDSRKSLLALKGEGPLGCAICHVQFPSPAERIQHAREKHKVHRAKFPCAACNVAGYSSSDKLQNHIKTKCLGSGWEIRLNEKFRSKEGSPFSITTHEKVSNSSEKSFKRCRSKSLSVFSSGKNRNRLTHRPLRPLKLKNVQNGSEREQETVGLLTLSEGPNSESMSRSFTSRKRRSSASLEKSPKIPKRNLKAGESNSNNSFSSKNQKKPSAAESRSLPTRSTIQKESLENTHPRPHIHEVIDTPFKKTKENDSGDAKPGEVSNPALRKMEKSRKTANSSLNKSGTITLFGEQPNSALNGSSKISNSGSRKTFRTRAASLSFKRDFGVSMLTNVLVDTQKKSSQKCSERRHSADAVTDFSELSALSTQALGTACKKTVANQLKTVIGQEVVVKNSQDSDHLNEEKTVSGSDELQKLHELTPDFGLAENCKQSGENATSLKSPEKLVVSSKRQELKNEENLSDVHFSTLDSKKKMKKSVEVSKRALPKSPSMSKNWSNLAVTSAQESIIEATKETSPITDPIKSGCPLRNSSESTDAFLDAKRLELRRLRESLGLDFDSLKPVKSSSSPNESVSPSFGSPKTPTLRAVDSINSPTLSPQPSPINIISKPPGKFALLDWNSFIARAQRKSRSPAQKLASGGQKHPSDEKFVVTVNSKSPVALKPVEKSKQKLQAEESKSASPSKIPGFSEDRSTLSSGPRGSIEIHEVEKTDDDSSESTIPCAGGSMGAIESESDTENETNSDQSEKISMLSCPICRLGGFATKAELKVHLTISCRQKEPKKKRRRAKTKKRPIEWYCPGCPRSFGPFESAKALLNHLPSCHIRRLAMFNGSGGGRGKGKVPQVDPNDLPLWPLPLPSLPVTFGCPVCGCFFATASRLDQHRAEADHFHIVGRFLNTNGHFKASK